MRNTVKAIVIAANVVALVGASTAQAQPSGYAHWTPAGYQRVLYQPVYSPRYAYARPVSYRYPYARYPQPTALPTPQPVVPQPQPVAPLRVAKMPATKVIEPPVARMTRPDADPFSPSNPVIDRAEIAVIPQTLLDETDSARRKQQFIDILLPLVLLENEVMAQRRKATAKLIAELAAGSIAEHGKQALRHLAKHYRVSGNPLTDAAARDGLMRHIDTIPPALALAQAANETAWGRSRFATEGRNLFGIWTWNESKGLLPRDREANKTHFVRRFDNLRESVRNYLHTLNSHPAYATLRDNRAELRAQGITPSGTAMAEGLERYSELGQVYIERIQEMIRHNDFERYNNAVLAARSGEQLASLN